MKISVDGVSARNQDGGLAGSILTLDQAVRNYRDFTRCSPAEAWAAASSNPATVIGEDDRGRIARGTVADIVLLDEQLSVQATLVGGELTFAVPGFGARIGPS